MRHLNGYQFTEIHKLFLFIFLFVTTAVCGQQPMYTNQQKFGVEEGLPQSYIKGITQDQDGFIWIATLDGLSRYDGKGFRNFRSRPGDTTGLTRNAIIAIVHQANNKISLMYEGLFADEFDMQTFTASRNPFIHTLPKIHGALWNVAQVNHVYNGTDWFFLMDEYKGVGWLNCKTGKTTYASKANGLLYQDTITAFLQTANGRLFLVSEDGVQVSDTAKTQFTFIRFPTTLKKHLLPEYHENPYFTSSVALLPGNRLLVYKANNILLLDLTRKTVQTFTIPAAEPGTLHQNSIMEVDSKGQPYFVNDGRIFRITEQGVLQLLWQNTIVPWLNITACYIDRSDVLWVSPNANGIVKVDLQSKPFQSFHYKKNFIADIIERTGATLSALPPYLYNPGGGWYYFRQATDSKERLYASCNSYDRNEIIRLDKKILYSFPHVPKNAIYTALVVMPDDEIRVFDQTSLAWYCWKNPEAMPDTISLDKKEMENIQLADARFIGGYMWLSTYSHGLLQYQDRKRISQFVGKLSNGNMPNELTEICPDPINKNQFWVGSRGDGLILWDVSKGLQKIYTTDDGLPNNTIYCILPDKSGKIWCSTNKGIFRLNPATGEINAFEKWDGLPGNEFNRTQKFLFPDGHIAFGGLDGYTILNPANFDKPRVAFNVPVQLTSLQINNESQDNLQLSSIIKGPLSTLSRIRLPYNKNYLRFEFAAMLFNQPQKTKYRYKLQGTDAQWIENGTSNVISYAALQPGRYKLLINATDNNGKWSNDFKEIAIIIDPPFWATWWAYIIYGLIVAGLARWYFIYREKRIKTEQSLAFEKREALRLKETDEVKDRFFSNITHEFRTPLTLILTPLEKLIRDDSLPVPATQTLKTIQKNSRQLLRLINELLDFSKLNDGRMKVKLFSGELSLFIANCVQSFESAAREKNILLSCLSEGVEGFYLFDEEKWEKIIVNLLGNALKFTPRDGVVSVSVTGMSNARIRLEIKDSGPGIPADQQQKIFERFYQADSSSIRNYGGTGIGLSLVKELVELMKGTIEVDSISGSYSKFIVEIPVLKIQVQEAAISSPPIETEEQSAMQNNEQDGPLIMIVEDNAELRSLLLESMRARYHVIAADGLQAWETITAELPDIVISDVMMPGRDGFDLCRLCKSDNKTAHIGFILLTSKVDHDARMAGLETGADGYITKPFHPDELELSIANLLQLQQKVRAHLQAQLLTTTPQEHLPEVTDPFLLRLYDEMDAKIDDPGLGVDYLCKVMGMSRSTLNRKLKSLLDISVNDLIRQYRLQKATGYLTAGVDIATAAYKVGFSSHSYFSQCFREQYGITPSDYVSRQN